MKWPFSRRDTKKRPYVKPVRLGRWRPVLEQLEDRLAPSAGPVGPEFQVNTSTSGFETTNYARSVAIDQDGDFVVVWTSAGHSQGELDGAFAQRYNGAGQPQGQEFKVNSQTDNLPYNASLAMDADGDFVVTWAFFGPAPGIYARRFNAAGAPQGNDFRVNTYTSDIAGQNQPSIAMDADGAFVITWTSYDQDGYWEGVFAQRFNALGEAQGSEFQVNSSAVNKQQHSDVAMDPDGNFVIVWQSAHTGSPDIYARRYNAEGEELGNEFLVNTHTFGVQRKPSVAMDAEGNFVIAWEGEDSLEWGVFARRYDRDGVAQGDQFLVGADELFDGESDASVAMGTNGDFVVTWGGDTLFEETYEGGEIFGQCFNAAGQREGGPFLVNSYIAGAQEYASVAMDADGDFVIVWESWDQVFLNDVFAQRYENDNRSPTTTGFSPVTLEEDAADTVLNLWNVFDDTEDGPSGLSYTVRAIDDPSAVFSSVIITGNDSLVLDYAPNAFGTAAVRIRATDSGGLFAQSLLQVTVNPVADMPSVSDATTWINTQTTVGLVISRNPVDGAEVTYFKITGITNGTLFLNDGLTSINDGDFITVAQGNTGLKFTPALDFVGLTNFTVQASTSASDEGLGSDTVTANITVQPPNTAPFLDNTGSPKLTAIPRNLTDPAGDAVADIVGNSITDPDGDPSGIAVVGLSGSSNGSWQYSTDGGASWRLFLGVSAGFARLLRDTDWVRFIPNAGFAGRATIAYHAWDRTTGTPGGIADLTAGTGGSTAFSMASETATLKVAMTLKPIVLGSKPPSNRVHEFLPPDLAGAPGIAIVGLTGSANGKWQYWNGEKWKTISAVSPNNALLLRAKDKVRFKPNPGFTGTAIITYHAWDRSVGKKFKRFNIVGSPAFSAEPDCSFAVVV